MTSKSKAKGNSAERMICVKLGEVLGGAWIRVPNSGAFLGGANQFRKNAMDQGQIQSFRGDIIPPSQFPKIVIESKFYKDFPFHRLLVNEPIPLLDDWLKQNLDICEEGDFPVLIFRINRRGSTIAVRETDIEGWTIQNYAKYTYNNQVFIITEFEQFLAANKERIITKSS